MIIFKKKKQDLILSLKNTFLEECQTEPLPSFMDEVLSEEIVKKGN